MPRASQRPDDEDLAAFAEGRLEDARHQAVLDRLAADEGYYELYVELLRFQDEEAVGDAADDLATEETLEASPDSDQDAEPLRFASPSADRRPNLEEKRATWRRWRRPLVGLAAAAVLAVGLVPRLMLRPPALNQLVVGLEGRAEDLIVRPGRTDRGGSGEPSAFLFGADRSFRLGAMLVDAVLLERATDGGADPDLRRRDPRLDIVGLFSDSSFLSEEQNACSEDQPIALCVETVEASEFIDVYWLRSGYWCRAAWLAAQRDDTAYLSSRLISTGLHALVRGAPDEETEARLGQIRSRLEARETGALADAINDLARDRDSEFRTLEFSFEDLELNEIGSATVQIASVSIR